MSANTATNMYFDVNFINKQFSSIRKFPTREIPLRSFLQK